MKLALSWLLYRLGDTISRTILRLGIGYRFYSKVMLLSSDLDKHGKIWKEVK
jgi:hypothetical protein